MVRQLPYNQRQYRRRRSTRSAEFSHNSPQRKTADQLRAFLSHPHGAMPDLALTRAEIDDLIGYVETLR